MLVTPKSTLFFAKNEAGGKGFNLYLMSQAGLPVPEWVVFGKRYFHEFLQSADVKVRLEGILDRLLRQELTPALAEKEVLSLFESTPLPATVESSLEEALQSLGSDKVFSVRSSAADEDSLSHSFAGQLSSYLYVSGKADILKYIRQCWASAFSERGLVYRLENKIDLKKISVSVVLQRMIDPDKSGVLFTCDPVAKKTDTFVVSSVYGVGEGLVSGALDADSFWLDAKSGKMLREELVEKKEMMKKSASGHCEMKPVSADKVNTASLNSEEMNGLYRLGQKIQEQYHRPQDIEWAVESGKIYILQTRPVTSLDQDLIGYPNLWDNSNIIESYGGLTSPLSFSFALRNYKAVYVQFCEVLGVPNDIIKDMDSYLSYMLGSLNGRVYYNLFNWYKLVGVLPGFKQNREFMETMMGVSEALSDEIANRIKPHPSWDTPVGRLRKAITGFNFIKYHFTIQTVVDDFLTTFHKDYDRFRAMPLKRMRGDQLIRVYMDVERNMLGRWKAPIINDFLCMVHFGLLRKLTTTWLKELDSTIQNDLLAGEGGLESAEPTKALLRLAAKANQNEGLRKLIEETDPKEGLEALNQSQYTEFYKLVLDYLDRFGFRCMSEMKLEEIDLLTDPSYLFVCLKNYLKSGQVEAHDDTHEKNLRQQAEAKVAGHLTGIKQKIYFWVLKHARKAVKNRENTRFARTRIYGIARTIFQTIGEDLASLGALENSRDIFWLTIEEVFGIYNGTLPSFDLKAFVELRKKDYARFTEETDPRVMTRGAVYWNNTFIKEEDLSQVSSETGDWDLKGLPCCPGVLEGVVKVIINPSDNLDLNGEILVTARTDPGWVPLYPAISGLLVERGSLLSHSAIVAREMGIPAIVSIPGLTKKLKTGMRVRIDAKAGTIKILSE
ncbi:Prodigiosin synthesizing transferase PigC [Bdellovibrio bacteriovorus]|uniref:phosphoenolpyruvate synthase n=1 Tax=Bdellovibrio bacteriovorus TaxID=959 RepID=UPI00045BFCA9|nr:phosphoenolpyruvate synthase [Bdellovibrio bacteriovorus]AHZ83541.1 phosphoenolpyruvate synthase [Bdellovibrio bacteriovorus]BEV69511.1 Prodigiosin synthesizing transferase PigC [Bdellovibrio bacteriovorus]